MVTRCSTKSGGTFVDGYRSRGCVSAKWVFHIVSRVFILALLPALPWIGDFVNPAATAMSGEPMATATVNGNSVHDGEGPLLQGIIPTVTYVMDGDDVVVTITQSGMIFDPIDDDPEDGFWKFNADSFGEDKHYGSFTIHGGTLTGDDRLVLENDIDPNTGLPYHSALVSIVNAAGRVEVSNLIIRGGSWRYDGVDASEVPGIGIGLNIGLTNEPNPTDVAPQTIVVRDVRADANVYQVENDFTTAASGTGINVTGMSADGEIVSDVLFERVELTGNHMTLTATGSGASALAPVLRGGGSRINSA